MQDDNIMIAHIDALGNVQTIKEHLLGTAEKAEKFAAAFGCGEAGFLCGLLHDIGKYSAAFQTRIRNPLPSNRVDHSTAGAVEIQKLGRDSVYAALGMAVAGHHSGLLDGGNNLAASSEDGTYCGRLKMKPEDCSPWEADLSSELPESSLAALPKFYSESGFSMSFFIRMIFSCLVDADYLDTEDFMEKGQVERGGYDSLETLRHRFEKYVSRWLEAKDRKADVNRKLSENRNDILQECMEKGENYSRGLYTLTVPTGGGKTTASMGFALRHACRHDLKRIIYVIPYTSVIDQNAAVFGNIFGQENVLEHHSGILYDVGENQEKEVNCRKALSTENWDAPIIVTTAVQFLSPCMDTEAHNAGNCIILLTASLFLTRRRRCRSLIWSPAWRQCPSW